MNPRTTRTSARHRVSATRGQSSVIGVALLVGVTMLALGGMAVAVGGVVEDAATDSDIRRVTADFDRAFRAVETTGQNRATIQFSEGTMSTEHRTLRLLNDTGVVETYNVNATVYSTGTRQGTDGDRRVTALGGAILSTQGDYTHVVRPPPIASGPDVLVVGVPVYHGAESIGGTRLTLTVETSVTHSRRTLGTDRWRVAVETTTPDAWNRTMRRRGATTEELRDFDGDGIPSVVARFPDPRTAHVVRHDVQLEVRQ